MTNNDELMCKTFNESKADVFEPWALQLMNKTILKQALALIYTKCGGAEWGPTQKTLVYAQ